MLNKRAMIDLDCQAIGRRVNDKRFAYIAENSFILKYIGFTIP